MRESCTARGFSLVEFTDSNGAECSIQKSSSAMLDKIWLGCDDADPVIMASKAVAAGVETTESCGWVKYPVSDDVSFTTRMHLTREQVSGLLPYLQKFADTGELGGI